MCVCVCVCRLYDGKILCDFANEIKIGAVSELVSDLYKTSPSFFGICYLLTLQSTFYQFPHFLFCSVTGYNIRVGTRASPNSLRCTREQPVCSTTQPHHFTDPHWSRGRETAAVPCQLPWSPSPDDGSEEEAGEGRRWSKEKGRRHGEEICTATLCRAVSDKDG